jgi:cold shock CspA family protein
MRGEMLWFNEAKQYGFINTDDGERLYVHLSAFTDGGAPIGRCAGKIVTFERVADDLGVRASAVSFVEDGDARRARPRRNQNSVRS